MNIAEIEMQLADLVKQSFDSNEFPFKFLEIYNAPKATLTKLRSGTQNKGQLQSDVLWSRKLYFRCAPEGQVTATLDALRETKAAKSQKPRFLLVTDGREVAAYDTKIDDPQHFDFDKLNDRFDFFLPLAGIEKYEAVAENPADIKAAGRLAKLHDEIERHNPDWLVPEKRHPLNQFLTRILFCMFAEDTGSFPQDLFVRTISDFGGADGEHLQSLLKQLFDVMNVPDDRRGDLPAHIRAFPYVNGGLFADSTEVPVFNRRAKRMLVEAAQLDWREINPDIFGSMIQAVVDTEMRGDLGMHYTSVPNIMKVLQPLFLMSLEEEFERARGHREERSLLQKLLTRISKIRVFDPACGSGNFLIIAYRELRKLEMRIFQRLDEIGGGQTTWREQSGVKLSSFYGIELADFAAETTKLSLWIAEYQMNQRFKSLFGEAPKSFPLRDGGHIVCGNALRLDWLQVCPRPMKTVQKEKIFDLARVEKVHATEQVPDDEAETYVVGNPPYLGGKKLTPDQVNDMLAAGLSNMRQVDYVGCWFVKAVNYTIGSPTQFAFVATSSICQGEQVHLLWRYIFDRGHEIGFAYEPFKWSNNAANNAGVYCTIIGVRRSPDNLTKRLFASGYEKKVKSISPYLIEGAPIFVVPARKPINGLPEMCMGSNPVDGKHLVLSRSEFDRAVAADPGVERFLKRYMGGNDFIDGQQRYCIWIRDEEIEDALKHGFLAARIDACQKYRLTAGRDAKKAANRPHRFCYSTHEAAPAIICPNTSSSNRLFLPVGFVDDGVVINKEAFSIYDPPPFILGLMSSTMHRVWLAAAGGRIGDGFRYSVKLVYNNFPLPELSNADEQALEEASWQIIAAREAHAGKTIAWLYDPDTMPNNLHEAHRAVDEIIERLYIGRTFKSDSERLEHLFKLYAEMTTEKQREVALA